MRLFLLMVVSCIAGKHRGQQIVGFGDSFIDTGNHHLECDCIVFPPFGVVGKSPSDWCGEGAFKSIGPYEQAGSRNLLPRFTNGKVWLEYLTKNLKNYAFGGAFAGIGPVTKYDLAAQVKLYLTDYPVCKPDTVHVIAIGSSDASASLFLGQPPGPALLAAVSNITAAVKTLYDKGARRFFISNIPDLGTSVFSRYFQSLSPPDGPTLNVAAGLTAISKSFGQDFLMPAIALLQKLPGVQIVTFDMFALSQEVYASKKFITDRSCFTPNVTTAATCEEPDDYMFLDGLHPTNAVHRIFAKDAKKAFRAFKGFLLEEQTEEAPREAFTY